LAELLVVIAIIGLLVAILVPSLTGARTQSKIVATQSLISSLGVSLDQFKQESRLGAYYPPSTTDDDTGNPALPRHLADPFETNHGAAGLNRTTGASLLVYALNGADGLGTPGFIDRNNDGKWADDFGFQPSAPPDIGGHALDTTTREPLAIRYGPYANTDPQLKAIHSFGKLKEKGTVLETQPQPWAPAIDQADNKHLVFADSFGHPILYYRARRAARAIIPLPTGAPPTPGVYDPIDNASIVGDLAEGGGQVVEGLQFRVGLGHKLAKVQRDLQANDDPRVFDPTAGGIYRTNHAESFERFIWDSKVTGRITPVNKDTFILISAGPDASYGTADDVTNFGK
jgi:type II secretory pathway pseudopilin PulG